MSIDRDILTQVASIPSAVQRAQTAAASEKAGIVFYRFQGRPIDSTRPWCRAREGKVWHIEEIRQWGRDAAAGQGWDGMVEGTNEQTIFTYLGGWYGNRSACRHVLVPVLPSRVPAEDMERIRDKGLLAPTPVVQAAAQEVERSNAEDIKAIRAQWENGTNASNLYRKDIALSSDFNQRIRPELSTSEVGSLREYTGSAYESINKFLRRKPDGIPDARAESEMFDTDFETITALRSILAKQSTPSDEVVFRGVGSGNTATELADMARVAAPGTEFTINGFASATIKRELDFISRATTVLRILIPKGSKALYVAPVSRFPNEKEMLLDHQSSFVILGTQTVGGKTFIDVRLAP
jgi:hypothetical protein